MFSSMREKSSRMASMFSGKNACKDEKHCKKLIHMHNNDYCACFFLICLINIHVSIICNLDRISLYSLFVVDLICDYMYNSIVYKKIRITKYFCI